MAVDSTHSDYDKTLELWQTMRDTSAGERAVKEAGETYLPKLGGQEKGEYAQYKQRASYYNATGRTIDGLTGMIFRKPPEVDVPDGLSQIMEDVTLGGLSFSGFAEGAVDEAVTVGRAGILVDFPRVEIGGLTQAEAERMNLRPFLSLYKAESIINWRTGQLGNKTVVTQVRLRENSFEDTDEFTSDEVEQIRVLDLDDNARYRQRVYRKEELEGQRGNKYTEWVQQGDDIYPTMGGNTLDYIPFIFIGPKDTTPNVSKPPLIDLADKNLNHYRMDADYRHGLHFVALPTPYAIGLDEDEQKNIKAIGPTVFLASSNENASFGMLEYTGAGLDSIEKALANCENQMASLGARMLAPEKRAAEAAETAAIHRQGEISVLASLANAVSIALTEAMTIVAEWAGVGGDVVVSLNTDYLPKEMDPQMITALTQALQEGGISHMTYIEALKRGEVIRADITPEDEQQRIIDDEFAGVEPV
ncbi:MAG: DUF4055 domain-containing protein [Verrucomicrobia bacterium]|jgi:hypothetical protein|nr:DUF4055 domain-containing protein [Verrucomicrobiota bacterium]